MTDNPNVVLLADHPIWLAVPAFAPAFVVAGAVAWIAMKDRRKRGGPQGEDNGINDQDGSP